MTMEPELGQLSLNLTQSALANLDAQSVGLSSIARTTLRIARLNGDHMAVLRLEHELHDDDDSGWYQAVLAEALRYMPRDDLERRRIEIVDEYLASRRVKPKRPDSRHDDKVNGWGLPQIERILEQHHRDQERLDRIASSGSYFDRVMMAGEQKEIDASRFELETVLERVKQWIYTYLTVTEQQQIFAQVSSDIFARYRLNVDHLLMRIAPEVLSQLNTAYLRASENDPEAFSQAAVTCRRVLKTVADTVYPARTDPVKGSDGELHDVSDDKYVNRIWQFLSETMDKSRRREVITATVRDLGERVEAINNLASKGAHAQIDSAELDQCVIQTYLVVGDILRVYEGPAD